MLGGVSIEAEELNMLAVRFFSSSAYKSNSQILHTVPSVDLGAVIHISSDCCALDVCDPGMVLWVPAWRMPIWPRSMPIHIARAGGVYKVLRGRGSLF
jgi:hypothetical protein